jgi:hypothetical protein
MVRYFQAGTNIVGLPKKMVFIDKENKPHLLNTLTKKRHIANHYGASAIETTYNPTAGNLLKITRGTYADYNNKVKKQKKAVKELVRANDAVETAVKRMRGRPRKYPVLTEEEKQAMKEQKKIERTARSIANKEQKKIDKAIAKAEKQALQLEKEAGVIERAIAREKKKIEKSSRQVSPPLSY